MFLLGSVCGLWQWLASPQQTTHGNQGNHHQWPENFEGQALTPLPMTNIAHEFGKGFPGKVGNFRCGDKQIILRYVTRATRKLHPAADCLRASGHSIGQVKIHTDADGRHWSGCEASKAGQRFFILERIIPMNSGKSEWTDVSSWHWHALLSPDNGPWLAITIISHSKN